MIISFADQIISKFEYQNPKQIQNTNVSMTKSVAKLASSELNARLDHLKFGD